MHDSLAQSYLEREAERSKKVQNEIRAAFNTLEHRFNKDLQTKYATLEDDIKQKSAEWQKERQKLLDLTKTTTITTDCKNRTATVSDSVIAPKPFMGQTDDLEAEAWLEYFDRYCLHRGYAADNSLTLFTHLMRGGASDWLSTLPDGTIQSYKELKQAFKDNYFRPAELRWKETGDLWNQTQGNFEKVEDFINRMRKSAKRIALDPGMLKDAVIHGLRPTLRMFVLQQKPGSLEETIRMAKVAEATAQPSLDNVSALLMEAMNASTKANEAQAAELKTLAGKVAALTEWD